MLMCARGFTLYELLITLALLAVLGTLALPSFSSLSAKSRQTSEINALFHAFHQARKESIMRRRVVSLCPSRDGLTCDKTKDWSGGWLLFYDPKGTGWPGDGILTRHVVAETVQVAANRRLFTARGTQKRTTNGTIVFCDRRERIAARALVVSYTGRPRVADRRPDGSAWTCAD
jgi:type IV fimbrial biogenesis protein FimT